ncbi:helix-turn-helix domain-containing protein [Edwardsiella tarda]|uniref:helix-turn-helix domain-containing protein n=1 Tax=Edwardsiella tarda TaxID=636 RepID=UPI00083A2F40|nr:helix-turn-helix domain-containing protein [Edwardsiella tarda]
MNNINKFKEMRLSRAWSQEQLAEMAGLSVRTVQRIENGERPGLETLSALAAVFGVSVAEISGPDVYGDDALDQRITAARMKLADEGRFYRSVITAVIVCLFLYALNRFTEPDSQWSLWVAGIWCALLTVRWIRIFVFGSVIIRWQQKRLQKMLRK